MEKLLELSALVECSIQLHFNEHKEDYESVAKHWFDPRGARISPEIVGELNIDADVWTLRIYSRTPVAFYEAISNDLDALIQWAIDAVKEERNGRGA